MTPAGQAMLVPVLLAIVAMPLSLLLYGLGERWLRARRSSMRRVQFAPVAHRDPRRHVQPRRRPYDWSTEDRHTTATSR